MAGGVTSLEKIRGDLIGQSCRDGAKISRLGGVKMREIGLLMFFFAGRVPLKVDCRFSPRSVDWVGIRYRNVA